MDPSSAAADIFGTLAPGYSPLGALATAGLGALSSLGNMGASRLPYPTMQVVGQMAGGAANALNVQRQAAMQAQNLQMNALNLGMARAKWDFLSQLLNGGAPGTAFAGSPSGARAPASDPSPRRIQGAPTAPTIINGADTSSSGAAGTAATAGAGASPDSDYDAGTLGLPPLPFPNATPVQNAAALEMLVPGAGKDIIAKYYPGPTDAQRALVASGISPTSPMGRRLLSLAAAKTAGVASGFEIGPTGAESYVPGGSADPHVLAAQESAKAWAGVGPKEATDAFNAGLQVRANNEIEKRKAYYATGVMPPDYGGASKAPPIISPDGDLATPRGTVVPAPPSVPYQGTDAITKQNAATQKVEENFGAIRGTLDQTEGRLVALASAFKTVQTGGLSETRADIANNLRGAGFGGLADSVMNAKSTAAVQTALGLQVLDVLGQLKQINQGTGGRILNAEFVNLLNKQYGPDLSPQANFDLITQALGGVYQTRNAIDDYYRYAKPAGWRDANGYLSAYYAKPENGMTKMVDAAGQALGPLKGMSAGAPQIPAAAINYLRRNPSLAPRFDAKYGADASKPYLGGAP